MSKKIPWPGLVHLEEQQLRRVFREMLMHVAGEPVNLNYLGRKLAAQLINITTVAEWHSVRKEVLLARRRIAYDNRKQATIQRKLDRRAYMRNYMKNYRRKGTTPPDVG